jgi:hypothetical protein
MHPTQSGGPDVVNPNGGIFRESFREPTEGRVPWGGDGQQILVNGAPAK